MSKKDEQVVEFKRKIVEQCILKHQERLETLKKDLEAFRETRPRSRESSDNSSSQMEDRDLKRWQDSCDKISDALYRAETIVKIVSEQISKGLVKGGTLQIEPFSLFEYSVQENNKRLLLTCILIPVKRISNISHVKVDGKKICLMDTTSRFLGQKRGVISHVPEHPEAIFSNDRSERFLGWSGKTIPILKHEVVRILG